MDHLKHDRPTLQNFLQAFGQHVPQLADLVEQVGQAVDVFAGCAQAAARTASRVVAGVHPYLDGGLGYKDHVRQKGKLHQNACTHSRRSFL